MNFFDGHQHSTSYRQEQSALLEISTSIIQGSAIGPASYVVNTGDLTAGTPGNSLRKYFITPDSNSDSRTPELQKIETWAQTNNLKLNRAKTVETVFTDGNRRRQDGAR